MNAKKSLLIAIDYEGTITADIPFWIDFVKHAEAADHRIVIATGMKLEEKANIDERVHQAVPWIVPTEGKPKRAFLATVGIHPDIWIDDSPEAIITPAPALMRRIGEEVDSHALKQATRAAEINERLPKELRSRRIIFDPLLPEVLQDISQNNFHRHVVVFNQIETGAALQNFLLERKFPAFFYTGATTTARTRRQLLEKFRETNFGVLLVSRPMINFLPGGPGADNTDVILHCTRIMRERDFNQLRSVFPAAIIGTLTKVPDMQVLA